MDKASVKKAAKRAEKAIRDRPRKANRTLSLSDDLFIKFKGICEAQNVTASEVLDKLIEAYVEEFK